MKHEDQTHADGTVTRDGKRYGCHVDLRDGEKPDGCVLDPEGGGPGECGLARLPSGKYRRSKWTCSEWKAFK